MSHRAALLLATLVLVLTGMVVANNPAKKPPPSDIVPVVRGPDRPIAGPRPPDRAPARAPVPAPTGAAFADAFSAPEITPADGEDTSAAVQGFSDRTGPPTLSGGGFSGSPEDKPLQGEPLDIP